ncbi:MAG: ABC transporter permease [Bryobacteraceae bacterium]|nr:ABC transporter permease [Bryobacteraceae bacterium]
MGIATITSGSDAGTISHLKTPGTGALYFSARRMWRGDAIYLLQNLILKDFRIRYRNMSLGVFWSLLNPLVMMGVLTFVFTQVFPRASTDGPFAIFVLCGIIPFNFFALAWSSATVSIVDNVTLVKRVSIPREIVPVSVVLGNCVHLGIQIALLLLLVIVFGKGVNVHWLWLPLVWVLEIAFVCGVGLLFSALDVYVRDMRYVVESANTVLFWLVPVFYPLSSVRPEFHFVYEYNPIAALILVLRTILLEAKPPVPSTLVKLAFTSLFALILGYIGFRMLKRRFYDYL